jgi:hypothetical protein
MAAMYGVLCFYAGMLWSRIAHCDDPTRPVIGHYQKATS